MIKRNIFLTVVLLTSFMFAYGWQHLARDELNVPLAGFELTVPPGASLYKITQELNQQKILSHPRLLRWYAVLRGYANQMRAGEYLITYGTNPIELLDILRAGNVRQHAFTIIEGQRVRDVIAALHADDKIEVTLSNLSEADIIAKMNIPAAHLEGLLWPETYFFTAKTTDVDFLHRAYLNMQTQLQTLWLQRDPSIKLNSPYEALILASIIEKESGVYEEFAEISGVYHRRLAKKMRLQADPTVIYALGDMLQGPLLKSHLTIDSPYNTYIYSGLPPTPIAIPSLQAIQAALHPAAGETLYFVATGDGGHIFSKTLEEHNKAVSQVRR